MKISKSILTNFISISIVLLSFVVPKDISSMFLYSGLFALSGAITNQIAIHMLFEKVPFFYGSGIIELKFEELKKAIKDMIMEQFFTKDKLNSLFKSDKDIVQISPLIEKADFSLAFDALTKSVLESQFGSMIGMIGGEKALESLREPFSQRLKSAVIKIVSSSTFKSELESYLKNSSIGDEAVNSIDKLVSKRLDELTPKMVKEMMQNLMREHLGWLIVWGGVFGGFIGLISSFFIV